MFGRDRHRGRRFSSALYVIGIDGRGLRRLARVRDAVSPVWSPSGRWIAFSTSADDANPFRGPLYIVDRRGRRVRRLLTGIDETRLSWQPR